MAALAEVHVVLLFLHQHPWFLARVWLMASQTIDGNQALGFGVDHIGYGVLFSRVAPVILQGQEPDLTEIVLGQPHLAAENSDQMRRLLFLGLRIRPVTLQAQRVDRGGTQQMVILAAVRVMADGTSLFESRLMQMRLLSLLCLIRVALQADAHRIALGQARPLAGMRIVTIGAIAGRAGMLNLCALDQFRLVVVTGQAKLFGAALNKDHLSILCRCMTAVACLCSEGRVLEGLHELGRP